jgi:hypothetical protein
MENNLVFTFGDKKMNQKEELKNVDAEIVLDLLEKEFGDVFDIKLIKTIYEGNILERIEIRPQDKESWGLYDLISFCNERKIPFHIESNEPFLMYIHNIKVKKK